MMIKLQVIGNLGRDAVNNNVGGKSVINFSVAHSEKYKDANGQLQDRTTWVECAYWTDKVGIMPYLTKGKTVYAEGIPTVESYTTKDGRQGATMRLRVNQISLIGGAKEDQPNSGGAPPVMMQSQQQQPTTGIPEGFGGGIDVESPF